MHGKSTIIEGTQTCNYPCAAGSLRDHVLRRMRPGRGLDGRGRANEGELLPDPRSRSSDLGLELERFLGCGGGV